MTAIASLLTNAFKTVQPSAKDKEDTYRRAIVCQPVDFFMVTANTQRRNLFYFRCGFGIQEFLRQKKSAKSMSRLLKLAPSQTSLRQ